MSTHTSLMAWGRAAVGAVIGGVTGFFAFRLLASQGLYGLALPGAILGLTAGWMSNVRSVPIGICCGLLALCLCIFSEWSLFPFIKDNSFAYFIAHVHQLRFFKLVMIGIGAVFGFWFGMGRDRIYAPPTSSPNQAEDDKVGDK